MLAPSMRMGSMWITVISAFLPAVRVLREQCVDVVVRMMGGRDVIFTDNAAADRALHPYL